MRLAKLSPKIWSAIGVASFVFAVAAILGWRDYLTNPAGVLLTSSPGPCPALTHSFGFTVVVVLAVAGVAAGVVAFVCFMASLAPWWPRARHYLRGAAQVALIAVPLFAVSALLIPVFEYALPQQPLKGCEKAMH